MVTEKNVKALENSQASLTLTVDAATIEKAYQARLAKIAKTIEMPGFRKGHVPASVLERKYGEDIRTESTFDCMEENLKETITTLDEKDRPLPYSTPVLQDEETLLPFKKDSDITFTVVYDIYPVFDLPQYTGLEVEVRKGEVTDGDIDEEIKKLQDQNAMVVRKNGAAEDGDIVNIDYAEIDAEGNKVEATERTGYTFTIGSGYNQYKLDKDVVGMNAGDEKTIEKTYTSEDGVSSDLEGKTVKLTVKMNEVKFRDIPEVDDDFAQDIKDEYKTVADLKDGIRKQLEEGLKNAMDNSKIDAILKEIADKAEFPVPSSMIDMEVENSWQRMISQYGGIPEEQFVKFLEAQGQTKESFTSTWREPATTNIRRQLILDAIRKKEEFPVEDSEVEAEFEKAGNDSYSEDQKAYLKELIKDDLQLTKVNAFLLEKNTFKEGKTLSYKEYMTPTEE